MAFNNITDLALGNTLTIKFSEGIRQNLSMDFPEFKLVESTKVDDGMAREHRFILQSSFGPASVQYRSPGTRYSMAAEQQTEQVEAYAKFKEIQTTISFEANLYERLMSTKEKYVVDRLAVEIDSKQTMTRRQICIEFYGDGSGALATIDSANVANNRAVVSCLNSAAARGFAGRVSQGERLVNHALDGSAGAAPSVSGGTFAYWQVEAVNSIIGINTVTLSARAANGAVLTLNSWNPSSGELLYKNGQPTIPDLTNVSDWGVVSEALTGLGSLVSNDGRIVHGIKMEGSLAGTVYDAGGAQIDVMAIEYAMNAVKNSAGQGRYKWPKALMNAFVKSAFIEGRETDRRFVSATDGDRGVAKFCYIHGEDSIEFVASEFADFQNIYILPEGKVNGHKVLEFAGKDFKPLKGPGNSPWHLAPSGNTYQNLMYMFLYGGGVIVNNHAAACARITNFSV